MSPEECKEIYRRAFDSYGEEVLIRRYFGTGASRSKFEVKVRARISSYTPQELVGTIIQGDEKVIVLVEELKVRQFPLPLVRNDKVVLEGRELNIEAPDMNTRKIGNELIAYELQVRG